MTHEARPHAGGTEPEPGGGGWDVPAIALEAAGNAAAAAGGMAYDMLTADWEEMKTVWANTGAAGMSTGERIYATAGTAIASVVGVRQLSDAWTGVDAVDGHVQSFGENVLDATVGAISLGGTAFGIGVGVRNGLSKLRSKAAQIGAHGSSGNVPITFGKLEAEGFTAPKIGVNNHGQLTNGAYTLDAAVMQPCFNRGNLQNFLADIT